MSRSRALSVSRRARNGGCDPCPFGCFFVFFKRLKRTEINFAGFGGPQAIST